MARQHGVISRKQLMENGLSRAGIEHRVATGRLHRLHRGVYAVGRPEVGMLGRLLAAVLACGPGAVVSGLSAAALWGILATPPPRIEVTVPARKSRRREGIHVRARELPAIALTVQRAIPVTTPARTLVDLAATLGPAGLERAVNEADKLDLIDPERLRAALQEHRGVQGAKKLRELLDRHTFTLTDSALEQRFLRIVRRASLPEPLAQQRLNGHRVDFYWPELSLVVETDGLRYHRTPLQQSRDAARDQAHAAAGLTAVRFTHRQIASDPGHVAAVLRKLASRRSHRGGG